MQAWNSLIDTNNICAQKLLAHFSALQLLLRPVYPRMENKENATEPLRALNAWIRQLSDNIARLSEAQTRASSDAAFGDYRSSQSYSNGANPASSDDTRSAHVRYHFVPLQVANEYET